MKLRIRELRETRELRQIDVAMATGIDQKTLSNYETGKTLPDIDSMCRLADFFDVSLDYLASRTQYNLRTNNETKRILFLAREIAKEIDKLSNAHE